MKIVKKQIATVTAIILMLASVAFVLSTQLVKADVTATFASYASIVVVPNPIGVNQVAQVQFWLADPPPNAGGTGIGSRWENFQVTITTPSGDVDVRSGINSDPIGTGFFAYTPTEVGTYTFKMHYPGQTNVSFNVFGTPYNYTYLPSDSNEFELTVQEEPVGGYKAAPLPTEYWTRPITGTDVEWSSVSSNWLMASWNDTTRLFDSGGGYSPEGTAPNSAHILWTKPMTFGGLVGGIYGKAQYYDSRSYEQYFTPPTIINGRLYYNTIGAEEPRTTGELGNQGIACVDMNNGETLFTIPNASLSFGQIYNYVSPNQAGALAYLWSTAGSTWTCYDAWTGNYVLTLINVPTTNYVTYTSSATTFGPNGEIIVYAIGAFNPTLGTYTMTKWNSSRAIPTLGEPGSGTNYWQWRGYQYSGVPINAVGTTTIGTTTRTTNGTEWTVPIANIPGQTLNNFIQGWFTDGDAIITQAGGEIAGSALPMGVGGRTFTAYSMDDGRILWGPNNITAPAGLPDDLAGIGSFENQMIKDGVLYAYFKQTRQVVAYDLSSGTQMWITEALENPWAQFVPSFQKAYGKFFVAGFDGMIHAYDITNGTEAWSFYTGNAELLTPYGTWPFYDGLVVCDGKVFGITGDHGNGVEPLYQGEKIYAVNATTGANVWNMTGWFERVAVADGKLMAHNCYDNEIYCFGKGPSATAVTAPMTAITEGTSVIIQGAVTDTSPGAKEIAERLGYADGVPAISDVDMSDWMAYLYEQQSLSGHTVTGVPVSIDASDPNGNFVHLGDAVSDGSGQFALSWTTPLVPGPYTIVATFAGSNSYWSSHAETHMVVSAAPPVTPPPEYPQPIDNTLIIVAMGIVLLIAIAIVGILLLRKK
jgi:hypothetical protein